MLDTNVIDALLGEHDLVPLLQREVQSGRVELLVTHLQIDEVLAMGQEKRAKRDSLMQFLALLPARRVLTYGFVTDLSRVDNAMLASEEHGKLFDELTRGNPRHNEDALIVLTAAWFYAGVVSEDVHDVVKMATRVGVPSYRTSDLRDILTS
jgi:hypothetical protein